MSNKEEFDLIDVREVSEYEKRNIGGINIPLSVINENIDKISKSRKVVIHCQGGGRSISAINKLMTEYGFENLWNLKGGINSF